MTKARGKSTRIVRDALKDFGLSCEILDLEKSTRTADEAARAVGCRLGQIAKALLFKTKKTHMPVLVIASGPNRVDTTKISGLVSEAIEMADPDFVRQATGFAIGGVPPIGHAQPILTFVDEDLLGFDEIWAAAGTPHSLFKLSPIDLQNMTQGTVTSIK